MESSKSVRERFVWLAVTGLAFSWSSLAVGQNLSPVADAGLPRYAATDPLQLDGSGSYDPDESGPLSYTWTQVSGPPVAITNGDTATPTISGSTQPGARGGVVMGPFVQTDEIQMCEFELVVSDGELTSSPGVVQAIIVPDYGAAALRLENPPFDSTKPTVVYFGGGDCVVGGAGQTWANWYDLANVISLASGYAPDTIAYESWGTYYRCGDVLIVYLSSVAPEYTQLIQTMGWSTGGQPALDAAIRLNRVYKDPRYAVNHVTELDAPCRWMFQGMAVYNAANELFLSSAVDGESCWLDHYWGDDYRMGGDLPQYFLGVYLDGYNHSAARDWYRNSLGIDLANAYNQGIVAGAYWSVIGPGKNLQLTPQATGHNFHWTRDGGMTFADETMYPGRLPEPVTLIAWANMSGLDDGFDGAALSCLESKNAAGYQLLLGSDPHRVAQYSIVSDTPIPPMDTISNFPEGHTWWTVRVRDAYGSTIYADPVRLELDSLPPLLIENVQTGKRYGLIGHAILDASPGDEIVLDPATYSESIDFRGKPLTITSLNPNDPEIVAATVVEGPEGGPAAVFSTRENSGCVLAGLTLTGGTVGVFCRDAAPTLRNCNVEGSEGVAIDYWHGYDPTITDCHTVGSVSVRPFVENMTVAKRYASVQGAIDEALEGHELVLSEGVCFEDIRLKGKNLLLRSTDPADTSVVASTIISGTDRAVTFADHEDVNCVVSGLTIADANEGIYCVEASPTIVNCVAVGNAIAGISLQGGGNPRISNCLIADNLGAGIKAVPSTEGRQTFYNYPVIINCTITRNAQHGVSSDKSTIANSIIYFNSGQIASASATVIYSNVQGGFPGEGNVDLDPLFADPENGDYRLKSRAGRWDPISESWITDGVTSPCIDAGDPSASVGDEPEPNGGRINMGAYGGMGQASKSQ